ncbi:MAG TPA: hypothetical protein DCS07_05485 [Bdellovibrionales bacterium]|nr:hypothetical protein [Bdellovibrionales bacterium]HCM41628.1 hypothetical protein [Bdellovibrionales bacterium]
MSYQRLTREERFQIQALLVRKTSVRDIARILNRQQPSAARFVAIAQVDGFTELPKQRKEPSHSESTSTQGIRSLDRSRKISSHH